MNLGYPCSGEQSQEKQSPNRDSPTSHPNNTTFMWQIDRIPGFDGRPCGCKEGAAAKLDWVDDGRLQPKHLCRLQRPNVPGACHGFRRCRKNHSVAGSAHLPSSFAGLIMRSKSCFIEPLARPVAAHMLGRNGERGGGRGCLAAQRQGRSTGRTCLI